MTIPVLTGNFDMSQGGINLLVIEINNALASLGGTIGPATGTGPLVRQTSPSLITPSLGTPSALVGTNITGTANGLTAGNVITNANSTGDVTSVGNVTTVAAIQGTTVSGATGTGYVVFSSGGTVNLGSSSTLNGQQIVESNITAVSGATIVTNIMGCTAVEYAGITPNASTLYFING